MTGFTWRKGDNPAGIPDAEQYCVRKALCLLMGWAPGSLEWDSIHPGPPGTDWKRLVEEMPHLGLHLYKPGEPDPDPNLEGIVIGRQMRPVYGILREVGHAEYGKHIGDVASQFHVIEGVVTRPS
jgi:hypothetical protein